MSGQIDAVVLQGSTLRVVVPDPPAIESTTLAVATALRVFERYPILDRLTLVVANTEISISREEVERVLGSEGFEPLQDWVRRRQVLARVAEAFREESPA